MDAAPPDQPDQSVDEARPPPPGRNAGSTPRAPSVPDSMGKRIGLLIFVALPFVVVGLLMWAIAFSLERQGSSVGGSGPRGSGEAQDSPRLIEPRSDE